MNTYSDLFFSFLKIGICTFGGGYAMIPIIEHHCVEKRKWITQDEMMDITVIAESTPGPIAINCATFVGYRIGGFFGSVVSTLGVVLPSFILILLISAFLDQFLEFTIVANAFRGIKIAVGIIITDAAIRMFKNMKKRPFTIGVWVCSFLVILAAHISSTRFSSVGLMLIAAFAGMICFFVSKALKKGEKP